MNVQVSEIFKLSVAERIAEDLWDSIAVVSNDILITEEQRQELAK